MKGNRLNEQIGSFKNKQQKGLFTFYLETTNSKERITSKNMCIQKETLIGLQSIEQKAAQVKKISQYRINNKPERRLKTLQACSHSNNLSELCNEYAKSKKMAVYSTEQFDQVKEILSFKKEKSKQILEDLLAENQVDNALIRQLSRKKQIVNPEKLLVPKKYTLNEYPQNMTPFNSGYLSKMQSKKYRSLEKDRHIIKNLSQQIISPKQKCNFNGVIAFNELDIAFKLQQQKFRPILFPFYKRKSLSYLKESQLSQSHLSSNDDLIQKLKNSKKMLNQLEATHLNIVLDTKDSQRQQEENLQVQAFPQRKQVNKKIMLNRLERSLENKLQKLDGSENTIEMDCFLRERVISLQRKKNVISRQRNMNYSQIKTRNSGPELKNLSTLEKIYRSNKNVSQKQLSRHHQKANGSNFNRKGEKLSNHSEKIKKNLLIVVTNVKDKYVSL